MKKIIYLICLCVVPSLVFAANPYQPVERAVKVKKIQTFEGFKKKRISFYNHYAPGVQERFASRFLDRYKNLPSKILKERYISVSCDIGGDHWAINTRGTQALLDAGSGNLVERPDLGGKALYISPHGKYAVIMHPDTTCTDCLDLTSLERFSDGKEVVKKKDSLILENFFGPNDEWARFEPYPFSNKLVFMNLKTGERLVREKENMPRFEYGAFFSEKGLFLGSVVDGPTAFWRLANLSVEKEVPELDGGYCVADKTGIRVGCYSDEEVKFFNLSTGARRGYWMSPDGGNILFETRGGNREKPPKGKRLIYRVPKDVEKAFRLDGSAPKGAGFEVDLNDPSLDIKLGGKSTTGNYFSVSSVFSVGDDFWILFNFHRGRAPNDPGAGYLIHLGQNFEVKKIIHFSRAFYRPEIDLKTRKVYEVDLKKREILEVDLN